VRERERERERVPWEYKLKWSYLRITPLDRVEFWIYYAIHHPQTLDCWDLNVLVLCERYIPCNISRKTCLQASHGRRQFLPPSTIGSYLIFYMMVILMSSSLWTVEIEIKDSNDKLFIGEQYIVNFQKRCLKQGC
jgi:hypothetical protein